MKLSLAYYGDPILRKKGVHIEKIDDEIRQLVNDMIETMNFHNGIGIAAPQVHRSLALFIISRLHIDEEGHWHFQGAQVFINPKIIAFSTEESTYSEGCLSIPKIRSDVSRPFKVTIRATNLEGEEFTEEFKDFEAHMVLHENDHINGVLFIDRLDQKTRKQLDPQLRAIKKQYH